MVTDQENTDIQYWERQLAHHQKMHDEAYRVRGLAASVLRARIGGRMKEIEAHIDNLRYAKNNTQNSHP